MTPHSEIPPCRQEPGSMIPRRLAVLLGAMTCLLAASCASTTDAPPPRGSAIIDAKPDPERREQIKQIKLVSINGGRATGTRQVIQPGLNAVKTQFRWPNGQLREANLRFFATAGTAYYIHYDVFPPRDPHNGGVASGMVDALGRSSDPYAALGAIFVGPAAAVIGTGERIAHGATRNRQSVTYIDLSVVARHSGQGVVRRVRAYPDGTVDEKPWAAAAQMKAP